MGGLQPAPPLSPTSEPPSSRNRTTTRAGCQWLSGEQIFWLDDLPGEQVSRLDDLLGKQVSRLRVERMDDISGDIASKYQDRSIYLVFRSQGYIYS